MLAEIIIPKMGDASGDCSVEEWKKSIGDTVEMGDVICTVATDKATFDIESPYQGTLAEILVQANVLVPEGTVIGRIEVSEQTGT